MKNIKKITLATAMLIATSSLLAQTSATENQSAYSLYKQEINKRFSNKQWEQGLTSLSERALLQEYAKMIGMANHLNYMQNQRQQRIEALLATYSALKMKK